MANSAERGYLKSSFGERADVRHLGTRIIPRTSKMLRLPGAINIVHHMMRKKRKLVGFWAEETEYVRTKPEKKDGQVEVIDTLLVDS